MLRILLCLFFAPASSVSHGQSGYKATETMAFNLIAGYQSFPSTGDIDQRLLANNFQTMDVSSFVLGLEFAVTGRRAVGMAQMRGTSIFAPQKVRRPTLQPASISFQYGFDLLQNAPATYLYPFAGLRYASWELRGRSSTNTRLGASENHLDALVGMGLKQFLNTDLRGVFNNIDFNIGMGVPVFSGGWRGKDGEGADLLKGTYKNKSSFFMLLTIGRAFQPAPL